MLLLTAFAGPATHAATNTTLPTAVLPEVVAFEAQALGTATSSRLITLRNSGETPLKVGVLTAIGDFQVAANHCPPALPSGASCSFAIRYVPTDVGLREGKVVVAHDDDNGSSEVELVGVGIPNADEVLFSAVNLQFLATKPDVPVTGTLAMTNNTKDPLIIGNLETDLEDFEVAANECGFQVEPGVKCHIRVRFLPTQAGARNGLLWLSTNAGATIHAIGLSGASTQNVAARYPR